MTWAKQVMLENFRLYSIANNATVLLNLKLHLFVWMLLIAVAVNTLHLLTANTINNFPKIHITS